MPDLSSSQSKRTEMVEHNHGSPKQNPLDLG